jgi:thiol:disulfide interchange protein DsbD
MYKLPIYIYILTFFLLPDIVITQPVDGNTLVKVEIFSDFSEVEAGKDFNLFIKLIPDKDWHTYWINPGDVGLPTVIDFDSVKGVKTYEPIFETPEKIPFSGMANFGYESENTIMIPIKISPDFNKDELEIKANIRWLVCKEECIPGSKKINFKIKVNGKSIPNSAYLSQIIKIKENQPLINQNIDCKASKKENNVTLEIPKDKLSKDIKELQFFPYDSGFYNYGADQILSEKDGKFYLSITLDNFRTEDPKKISGILVADKCILKDSPNKSFEINFEF